MEYILYKIMFLPSHYVKTNINIVDVRRQEYTFLYGKKAGMVQYFNKVIVVYISKSKSNSSYCL